MPIQDSGGRNGKVAAWPVEVCSAHALWAAQCGTYEEDLGNFNIFLILLHRNERGPWLQRCIQILPYQIHVQPRFCTIC